MAELTLPRDERLRLKSQSHHLDPIVLLGAAGLSEAVLKEIDRALSAHGLIKVRLPATQRDEREQLFTQTADRLGAARVQLIGRLMVLFRPVPQEPPARAAHSPPARTAQASGRPARARPAKAAAAPARAGSRKRADSPPRAVAGKVRAAGPGKTFDAASRPRSRTAPSAPERPGRGSGSATAARARSASGSGARGEGRKRS